MVAPEGEDAVPGQEVQVAVAPVVDQVGALTAHPPAIEAERSHDSPQLGVEIAVVERHLLAGPAGEDLGDRAEVATHPGHVRIATAAHRRPVAFGPKWPD